MPGYMTLEQMMKSPNSEMGRGPKHRAIERINEIAEKDHLNMFGLEDMFDESNDPEFLLKLRRNRMQQMIREAMENRQRDEQKRRQRQLQNFGFPMDPNRQTPYGEAM